MGKEFLFRMMKKLEIDTGNGYTRLGMYLMPLNCMLKNGYNSKCYVHVFYTI